MIQIEIFHSDSQDWTQRALPTMPRIGEHLFINRKLYVIRHLAWMFHELHYPGDRTDIDKVVVIVDPISVTNFLDLVGAK